MLIGITGRTATGKSTLAGIFHEKGFSLIDADAIYHKLLENSDEMRERLIAHFNSIDKRHILERITSSYDEYMKLNEITHPYVMAEINGIIGPKDRDYVLDVPVPLKEGFVDLCDYIIVTDCAEEIQKERLMQRKGMTEVIAGRLMGIQKPRDFYRKLGHCIVFTDDMDEGNLRELAMDILKKVRGMQHECC